MAKGEIRCPNSGLLALRLRQLHLPAKSEVAMAIHIRGNLVSRMSELIVMAGRSTARLHTVALVLALVLATILSAPSHAYDKVAADAYAEKWWNGRNPSFPNFSGTDCANFVSQAINAGGYPMTEGWDRAADSEWWARLQPFGWYNYTYTWSVASELRLYLLWGRPGASSQGSAPGSSEQYWTPDIVTSGDPIFYDWGLGEGISHAAIQTGYGDDPNSDLSGNFVNQHSNNRKHAFWSLKPYNEYWRSTKVHFVHIYPSS